MSILIAAFAISVVATLYLVRLSKRHDAPWSDHDTDGPQKFHVHPVPRAGGVGIVLGLLGAFVLLWLQNGPWGETALALMACGVPAFAFGLAEDVTKRVSPRARLLATAVSAALAFWLLDAAIRRTDIPGLDDLVALGAGSAVVTVFAVAGIANSVNIIDGFNGLASMCVVLILASLAYVGFVVGDPLITLLALAGIGAVLGFFVWNFPAGLIFLGDGGAYFLGFYVAELALLLLVRNPQVSPLFPLLVCVYPAFETLFSIYRRKVLRALPPSVPDGIHLHSLIYRRIIRWAVGDRSAKALTRRNSMTSPFLWMLCMLSVLPAVLFFDSSAWMAVFLLLFGIVYVGLYWRIVRFKSPRWMRALATRPGRLEPRH
ncbi:MAG: glycosyltransferase family 4 protein [Gammaproteobacteria bacterium]|nr:glycosyltransferase family 4 protein [Gammaproteobacteria bacterium]